MPRGASWCRSSTIATLRSTNNTSRCAWRPTAAAYSRHHHLHLQHFLPPIYSGLTLPGDGAGQADMGGGVDQFGIEDVHESGQETPASDAVHVHAGPAAEQVLDA
jgi:hypothetical protein